MKKKLFFILQCIIMVALFSGCWSRKEPKTLSMVSSILYDINDNGDIQIVTEFMNPRAQTSEKGSGGEKITPVIFLSEGKTVPEALKDESKSIDRVLFGGLNKVRLFSDKISKKGIAPLLDYLSRDHLTDETPLMVVVQDEEPKRIYTCETGLSDMVGNYLESLSETQHKSTCESVVVTTLEFMKDYYEEGKQPVMGLIKIVESKTALSDAAQTDSQDTKGTQGAQNNAEKTYYIRCEGLAAFRDDKLVGYMDGIEARAYNVITDNFSTSFVSIPSGNDFTVAIIQKTKIDIKTNLLDDQVEIQLKVKASLSIIQAGDDTLDISKGEANKSIEQGFNRKLEMEILNSVKKAQQEFKSDIFGFGCFVHIQHPQKWKEFKASWNDVFPKAKILVTVESSAIREGEIKRPFALEEPSNDK